MTGIAGCQPWQSVYGPSVVLSVQKQTYNIHTFCKTRLSYPKWTTQQIQAALKISSSLFQYIQNTLNIIFVMSDAITTVILRLTLVLSYLSSYLLQMLSPYLFSGFIATN